MRIIVIDDERTFKTRSLIEHIGAFADGSDLVTHVRNSHDGLATIARAITDYAVAYGEEIVLFLDHDLGGDDDIRRVVDFLCVVRPQGIYSIYIHSQNPVSEDLVQVLKRAGFFRTEKIGLPELSVVQSNTATNQTIKV